MAKTKMPVSAVLGHGNQPYGNTRVTKTTVPQPKGTKAGTKMVPNARAVSISKGGW